MRTINPGGIRRRDWTRRLGAALAVSSLPWGCASPLAARAWVFAYFTSGKGEADGLKLAVSTDGFRFRSVAGGRSLLVPQVGKTRLLRDPFLFTHAGRYHLLWTTDWEGSVIGHATSTDLLAWGRQRALPVMQGVAGTRNCWAPEAIRDPVSGHWILFWSSTVAGRFTETAGTSEDGYNHRLWCTTTPDFEQFTPARPFYDPGFSVIDGTFARLPGGSLHLIIKDETLTPPRKWLQCASASGPMGPFGALSAPFTPPWVEGPMTALIGDELVCYYDIYREGRWGAAATRDMRTWRDVSHLLALPAEARHGSLLSVDEATVAALR